MLISFHKPLILGIILIFICISLFSPVSIGKEKFFPLEKIKTGMSGVGYTVFNGTKIEKFDVKVLEIVQNSYVDDKLILVRLSGKRIEENGGLSAGMSGSPVYIKGELAGAISYGFTNADPMLAMITPIESMFKLLDAYHLSSQIQIMYRKDLIPVPVATPVILSGMGERGFELMSRCFNETQYKPVYFPAGVNKDETKAISSIQPGSAIAVQMVSGDYQASAIGTVTWIHPRYFLAFGHPFTNKGSVDFKAFQAQILHTVKSPVMSFKLGKPLQVIGRIIEDRSTGIMGEFRTAPRMIEVVVEARDLDRNKIHTSHFNVIHNEQYYRDLITAGVTATIDKAIDRVGEGTASIRLELETNSKNPVIRENLYYGKDIAISSLKDLKQLLDIIATNEFTQVDLRKVKLKVEVSKSQETARIIKLESKSTKVKPGETIRVTAIVRSYRGHTFNRQFTINLPKRLQAGKLILNAHGGGATLEEKEEEKRESAKTELNNIDSLDGLLAKYLENPKNNEVVLEYYPLLDKGKEEAIESNESIKYKAETQYHILGEARLELEVIH